MNEPAFIKRLIYLPTDSNGNPWIVPIHTKASALEKMASRDDLFPKVAAFISGLRPEANYRHVLINALGAGEYYSSNSNGDFFPESALMHEGEKYGHKTFLKAGAYKHHNSKDKSKASGKVVMSEYNPQMHRVELIVKFDKSKDPDVIEMIDAGKLFNASMGCFPAGTPITMSDGRTKKIEDIAVGDFVLNSDGDPTQVTEVHPREYSGEICTLKVFGQDPVLVTPEHPYLTLKKDQVRTGTGLTRFKPMDEVSLSDASYIHASCLSEGDYVLTPVMKEVITPDNVTVAACRLLGYYLAEGHIVRNKKKEVIGIELSTGLNDAVHSQIERLCEEFGTKNKPVTTRRRSDVKCLTIEIYDRELADFCSVHAGSYAKKKYLSQSAMRWDPELQLHLLGSYLDGDGGQNSNWQKGSLYISTASEQLANQILHLSARCGILANVNYITHRIAPNSKSVVKVDTFEWQIYIGKQFVNKLLGYARIDPVQCLSTSSGARKLHPEGFILSPIKYVNNSITTFQGTVYNFEVKDGESYVAGNVAVHNCKVPSDFCSLCGHESKTVHSYCPCLRDGMNEIQEDGKIACAINLFPDFFDISRVLVGADKTSRSYGKVASADSYPSWFFMPSGLLAEKFGDSKNAAMEKEIPATAEPLSKDKAIAMFSRNADRLRSEKECCISAHDLKKAASYGLDAALSSFTALGIPLSRPEFQHLLLSRMGQDDLADSLHKLGYVFNKVDITDTAYKTLGKHINISLPCVNTEILKTAAPYLETKSVLQPYLLQRALMLKAGAYKREHRELEMPALETISGLYSTYLKKLAEFGPRGLRQAEKYLPEVKFILASNTFNDPVALGRNVLESEKVAADEDGLATVKDYVTGYLLSPEYKPLFGNEESDSSHWKLASSLPELTPERIVHLHPDTSAWMTVQTVNLIPEK